ncbi:hypothetical protein ACTWPT_48575 [Nonomuraea sp. 3N208]|uniref:hypothetical protein n=1 Tax=Nonomuraea sp. 3N208 TaxID=3457421 RepID=UPI003FD60604
MWVRPGQLQRSDRDPRPDGLDGTHVLFTAAFPPAFGGVGRLRADWVEPVCRQLGADADSPQGGQTLRRTETTMPSTTAWSPSMTS